MKKHTPGPLCFKDAMVYSEKTGQTIAMVDRENEADGVLFAAAPDMLRALEAFMSWHVRDGVSYNTVCHEARTAIAKAKGES